MLISHYVCKTGPCLCPISLHGHIWSEPVISCAKGKGGLQRWLSYHYMYESHQRDLVKLKEAGLHPGVPCVSDRLSLG